MRASQQSVCSPPDLLAASHHLGYHLDCLQVLVSARAAHVRRVAHGLIYLPAGRHPPCALVSVATAGGVLPFPLILLLGVDLLRGYGLRGGSVCWLSYALTA